MKWIEIRSEKENDMAKFVLLLKGGDFTRFSPEEMQKILEKYMSWVAKLKQEGRHHASEELNNTGSVLQSRNGQVVDGPFAETKETVGGFFLIEAKDLSEATRISRECPHLAFDGVVEVREVIPH
jgi:hypothetical protein